MMTAARNSPEQEHSPAVARLYVRNDAPFVARDRVREVETRLQAAGVDVSVQHWGRRIPWDEDREAHDIFEQFSAWADDRNVSLEPAFHRSCHNCEFTDESIEVLVPPVVTLAAYDADETRPLAVYPHHDGTRHVSVEEGLVELENSRAVKTA